MLVYNQKLSHDINLNIVCLKTIKPNYFKLPLKFVQLKII